MEPLQKIKDNRQIQVGDLVRYNAAGMRMKTLGIVLDEVTWVRIGYGHRRALLIEWVVQPSDGYLPRVADYYYHKGIPEPLTTTKDPRYLGDSRIPVRGIWYEDQPWIELANL